jgi:Fe-S-cluster-containing dehydrogenase component
MCIVACPLSVPFFDAALKVAVKCDFCFGVPECVKHCSSGALRLYAREEAVRFNERLYLSAKEEQ